MRIALFGATGFTGKDILQVALSQNHTVRALVRDPARVETSHPKLELVKGDALNKEDILGLLRGTDVVVHCLGVGGKGDGKPTTLVSDSVALVVQAMQECDISRIICMSNVGAGGSGPWFANKIVIPLFFRWLMPLIHDKDRMEEILKQSSTDWVSVRLPNIVEGPAKATRVSEDGKGLSWSITTESVAHYMLERAAHGVDTSRTPSVSN